MHRSASPWSKVFFAEPESGHLSRRFERALDSLWMAYQPIVKAGDGSLFGYEALVRSRDRLLARPIALFAAAEHLGQAGELCAAIRRALLHSYRAWPAKGALFLNLSVDDLTDDRLPGFLDALAAAGASVVLEVSEQASHDSLRDVSPRLAALRRRGFRIALDDFGAGWAGLGSFALLQPEVVKIDRSLVKDIHRAPIKQRIVSSVTELCSGLGILVVAEGIETADERETVTALGCGLLQGYHVGRPGPPPPLAPAGRCAARAGRPPLAQPLLLGA
jgi:EAL domain-containing protein (putative c-di-GMP-specific phosphodiesterase class I)